VKLGLRLQIVLLLGALLALTFLPLFWAVATYVNVTLQEAARSHAWSLARAAAAHISSVRLQRAEFGTALRAATRSDRLVAIAVYDLEGRPVGRAGEPWAVDALGRPPSGNGGPTLSCQDRRAMGCVTGVVTDRLGSVAAVARIDPTRARGASLVKMLGLYMAVMAASLLLGAYFALTRLIVRPLGELSVAAERVALGARRLEVPRSGAAELAVLGTSLRTMTEGLLSKEEALRRKVVEVEQATLRLEEAQVRLIRSERLASVGRLAAGLAHEIGNPISALIGLEDLLIAGGLTDDEQRDFLERMRRETERIHQILRDLLQFARPAAGRTSYEESDPGDVAAAVEDTAALVGPQRVMQSIELVVDVQQGLPLVLLGRAQLVQVILNLVLNAADACNGNGRVHIVAKRKGTGVELVVEDSGPGVPSEVREHLFEPFVTTKEVGKGTGLGLAVCRGLVEATGGTIALDTGYHSGARFVVTLPKAEPEVRGTGEA
jgi:signal transduction histidine kinase